MSDALYQAVFAAARVLELPVIVISLLSLAWLIVEVGAFAVELYRRQRRRLPAIAAAAAASRSALDRGDRRAALESIRPAARNRAMLATLGMFIASAGLSGGENRISKELADFDFACQKRLGRTRLLVRLGPALGLMGTLIPLSPALQGLANGDVAALTENLRVAFSVTVLGILIGVVAFALSLVRERLYGQDYSDLEFVAALFTAPDAPAPSANADAPVAPVAAGEQVAS